MSVRLGVRLLDPRCPDCGCGVGRHNAVNRVDRNPMGGPLLLAHCADDGACWRTSLSFSELVRDYLLEQARV